MRMSDKLPEYAELAGRDDAPSGSSWGLWGPGDVFGCLNKATAESAVRAAGLIREGRAFAMNLPADEPAPPLFDRDAFRHEVTELGAGVGHDDSVAFNTQASSQWDGFRHIRHPEHGFYNGVADEDHGVDHWAEHGIVTRGVLADVARFGGVDAGASHPIDPDDINRALDAASVQIEPGDVLLVRTGWPSWFRALDADARAEYIERGHPAPGLRPGRDTLEFLWNSHIAAIATDAPATEVWPPGAAEPLSPTGEISDVFAHLSILPLLGLPIGELFDLDALADDCAGDGVYEFMFTSAPLRVPSGVASPPNALAIK